MTALAHSYSVRRRTPIAGRLRILVAALPWIYPVMEARGAAYETARAEIDRVAALIDNFTVVPVSTAPGTVTVAVARGLTAGDLRGVAIDPDPPRLGSRPAAYSERIGGIDRDADRVYVAEGIRPFRFRYFDCEFHYDSVRSWTTYPINEYAATHGFNLFSLYRYDPGCWTHLPSGTQWVRVQGFRWSHWFRERGIENNRWDLWMQARERGEEMIAPGRLKHDPRYIRHIAGFEFGGLLTHDELRRQDWYPADAGAAERAEFERLYYEGYALSYSEPGRAARRDGWDSVSIYAWQPLHETWDGLDERIRLDTTSAWGKLFVDEVFAAYDIVHVYGYPTEWSPRYVAYCLLSMDMARDYSSRQPDPKPVWIYYSNIFLGRSDADRWLRHQPMPNEDIRAVCAMLFFQGNPGFVFWNYGGFGGDHRQPPQIAAPPDNEDGIRIVQVGRAFEVRNERRTGFFNRYDHLRLLHWDTANNRIAFRKIDPALPLDGQPPEDERIFTMDTDALRRRLRPVAEAVAPMVEGLALARAFEYTLRHGEVKTDQDMRRVWQDMLPVSRRVKCGDLHIIATYDPLVVRGGKPRLIELPDFDGAQGFTLILPADDQLRIFVLRTIDRREKQRG